LSVPIQTKTNQQLSLVLGVNGQDGSYLAESLIALGRRVVGVGRQKFSKYIKNSEYFTYKQLDIQNTQELVLFLDEVSPTRIYHVAAIHGAAGFRYEDKWIETHSVNILSVHAVLEYLRLRGSGSLIYTSSSKAFGESLPNIVSEETKRVSSCIYSIAKNSATDLIHYYRAKYGVYSNVLWTFNHESPRRGIEYFIPKIVNCLANALKNPEHRTEVFTLNFYSDWSDAAELMNIAIRLSDRDLPEDFIFASGNTMFARDFVSNLFLKFGLDYQNHIIEKNYNDENLPEWNADISKMRSVLGCSPKISIFETCYQILLENYGYDTTDYLSVRDLNN
jgi:GDPmannose 4,6-dehydratase